MYEIKVEESETPCPRCGKLLSAIRVRQSGTIPTNIFEAVQSTYRAKYPSLSVDADGWLLAEECQANHTAPLISQYPRTSPETDRAALIALYHTTDGPNWGNDHNRFASFSDLEFSNPDLRRSINSSLERRNANWLTDLPIGRWNGVTTDSSGRVTRLSLESNGLVGEIPSELGNLSNLEYLYLNSNQLYGEIPLELGNLGNLTRLWLGSCNLSGEIPPELGNLSNLEHLYLNSNQLHGEIPPELGNLANLTRLYLSENRLSGEIPPELSNLAKIQYLDMSRNWLRGEIPREIYDLANLKWLDLRENFLRLCEPTLYKLIGFARVINLSLKGWGEENELGEDNVKGFYFWRAFKLGLYFDDSVYDRNALKPLDVSVSDIQQWREQVDELLRKLSERESRLLTLRFGLEDGRSRTMEEVGRELWLTREDVRKIEDRALRKFRRLTGSPEFDPRSPRSGDLFEDELDDFFDEDCNGCSNESGVSI